MQVGGLSERTSDMQFDEAVLEAFDPKFLPDAERKESFRLLRRDAGRELGTLMTRTTSPIFIGRVTAR
jgi:hypothetical protein